MPESSRAMALGGTPRRRVSALALATAAVFLVLAATAEERTFGAISDEQQVLFTAVALVETGEIGIARTQPFTVVREAGDAVSPYGMGHSLALVLPTWLAPRWEAVFGARSSQTLYVLFEILVVGAAAAFAGAFGRLLGAPPAGQVLATLGVGLGSPLWAYVSAGYSEPVQALAFVSAVFFAAGAARDGGRGRAAGAGFAAGFLLLTKGVNAPLVPLVLAPLVLDGPPLGGGRVAAGLVRRLRERTRLLVAAAAGAALPLGAWLAFEIVRFGAPFRSYADLPFSHPLFDGLWRLLVGPNEGLFLYFPLLAVALAGIVLLSRRAGSLGSGLAVAGTLAALLAISATWWAWDGFGGWGPRFLVPALPLLGAAAGAAYARLARGARAAAWGLFGLGVPVNALGALQSDPATLMYVDSSGPVRIPDEIASWYPEGARRGEGDDGLVSRVFVAALDPSFAPIRLHAHLLETRLLSRDGEERRARLASPPWLGRHPEAVPKLSGVPGTLPGVLHLYLTSPFTWPRLGAASSGEAATRSTRFFGAWQTGFVDQIYRALDTGRFDRADALSARLHALVRNDLSLALRVESLRLLGRRNEAASALAGSDARTRESPLVAAAEALVARDAGAEELARARLERAARRFATPALRRALTAPLSEWPRDFRALTRPPVPEPPRRGKA